MRESVTLHDPQAPPAYARAAAYARVSTQDQAGERHVSLATQRERFESACRAQRWVPSGEFVDVASGRKDNRREYQRLIAACRAGEVDAVVVQYLDRFGRNPREILRRYWELEELGVSIVVTDEDIKEELILLMRAGMAGHESKRTSERVKATMARVLAEGRWPGRAPLGYVLVRDPTASNRGKLLIDESRAAVVRRIFDLYATDRHGFAGIAGVLNDERIPAPMGGIWWSAMVEKILRNPAYVGQPIWHDTPLPGGCAPLVEAETWHAVQEHIRSRKIAWSRQPASSEFRLPGRVVCACGTTRHCWTAAAPNRGGRKPIHYYRCGREHRTRACKIGVVRADRLDPWVVERVGQLRASVDQARAALAGWSLSDDAARIAAEQNRVRAQIARLEARQRALYDDRADRLISAETYKERAAEYSKSIVAARDELARLTAVVPVAPDLERIIAAITTLPSAAMAEAEPDELREVLAEVIERVEVAGPTPETWRIVWAPDVVALFPH